MEKLNKFILNKENVFELKLSTWNIRGMNGKEGKLFKRENWMY